MKKITLFLLLTLFATLFAEAQEERLATATRDTRTTQVQNTHSRALTTIYQTDNLGVNGAEITATANGPTTSMADAIVLAGTNRILQTVTVNIFNSTSNAPFNLTLRIYTDCTTNGASGACGSGPGTLVAASTVTQAVTPGPLGFIYPVVFTLPNVNLYGETDNNISVSLNASRNDVFWILNESPLIGSQPAGEGPNSVVQRCGSALANNGCARDFGLKNNFSMKLDAEAAPPNDLCANAITITGDGIISGTTVFATTDTGLPFCVTTVNSPGVWYKFTDNSGTGSSVTLSLCGGASFDTKIGVYNGTCGAFTCVTGNDDFCGLQSQVTFNTNGASTYYVLVHSFGGATGAFNLNVSGFPTVVIGNAPTIVCPSNITANNSPGTCGAVANFAGIAFDTEDGNISGDIVATTPSGSTFPVGDTTVTLTVTDSDGNTVNCSFMVTVIDNENPVAVCQDLTIDLDPVTGMATITAADLDNGSMDNCSIASMTLDVSTFDCSMVGPNTVTMTVTDASGRTATCTSTVTVQDVTPPEVFCVGGFGIFSESEDFEGATIPTGWTTVIDTGVANWSFGSGDMPFGPDFTSNAAIFNDDAAGNGSINLVRLLSPVYDLSAASNVFIGYDVAFREFGNQEFIVEVFDGAAWQQIAFYDTDLAAIQTESFDVSAFVNPTFQVRYTFDDLGGWGWGAGVDNFLLSYEAASGGGLDVFLDVNGMATINPNDLVTGVNEACGYTITAGGVGGGTMGSLTTLFATNNGGSANWTVMYDLTVGPNDIDITDLDVNTDATGPFNLNFYTLVGTHVGNETNAAAWGAPESSGTGTALGTDLPSNAVLATPVTLTANTTYGIAITMDVDVNYTNGTGCPGNQCYDNADLSLSLGKAVSGIFTGSVFSPRIWNGTIHYVTSGGSGLEFTCADLGENIVEVTVTDDSGNVSTCMAVVNVIDNIAPVITCGPEPTVSATVSDSPALAIPDGDPIGVTSSITITEDVIISDLNINLDVSHSWVGDVSTTITSPAGTSVTIVDRPGYTGTGFGCSGDDILATLDDAGTGAVESQCGAGVPTIDGTFTPNNPLSAFNGESTMGDWIITISDSAGGDTGTLNSWGITYSYANTNTDVVIELGPDGTASIDPYDIINSVVEACGIATAAVDVPTVSCADIGAPILVTVFVTDGSGNLASCTANVIVVDRLAPVLTCPADQTVDPGPGNIFYILPDYFATGEAIADDNCTDPVTVTTQVPAAGTALPDGVHTISFTATDEYGNMSSCDFELTVETVLGVNQNSLEAGVALYPNPASNVVNLVNKTNISLEKMMIYDINGRLVNQVDLRTMQGEKAVDVSSLAAGIYMVQIIGDNASTVKRLIKD